MKNAKGKASSLNSTTMNRKSGLKSNKTVRKAKGLKPASGRGAKGTKDCGTAPNKMGM